MEAVRHLNEKICVVEIEIEYKYIVEDDNQEATTYDSKTRKIQSAFNKLLQLKCGASIRSTNMHG
jgi:hypothetical protein